MIPVDPDKLCIYSIIPRTTTKKALQRDTFKNIRAKSNWKNGQLTQKKTERSKQRSKNRTTNGKQKQNTLSHNISIITLNTTG